MDSGGFRKAKECSDNPGPPHSSRKQDYGGGDGASSGGVKKTRVGMLKAVSPALAQDGVFIGIFSKDSVLSFYGHLKVRVLAGVINLESYAMKPCDDSVTLCIPQSRNDPAVRMAAMDPSFSDAEFVRYLKPFRETGSVHFHSKSNPHAPCAVPGERGCIIVELDEEDVKSLNKMVLLQWTDMAGVCLFKPFKNHLTELLGRYGLGLKNTQQLDGYSSATLDDCVYIPQYYKHLAWDLLAHGGVSVLICGQSGLGKSTLARYLINYMLNRYPAVAYLECDPGQCEFTCPEVLSLHVLREPVFGPSYTHQRPPTKAYYYGDNSPKADPEYYIRLLQLLYEHFTSSVRPGDPDMPLVINTCGWLYDMGVQLFLDILRSLSPSHIVRLIPKERWKEDVLKMLPPLTEDYLTTTPGLFTSADKKAPSASHPAASSSPYGGRGLHVDPFPGVGDVRSTENFEKPGSLLWEGKMAWEREKVAGKEGKEETGYLSSDIEMYGSSEEEFTISAHSSGEDADEATSREERVRKKRKLKRNRLHLTNVKLSREKKKALEAQQWATVAPVWQWEKVLSYKMQCLQSPAARQTQKKSQQQRQLRLVSHFLPLLSVAQDIAKQNKHLVSDSLGNMLKYAPPLEIPWGDVAIHVAHKQVPVEHMLYAMNGKVVCLGHVQPEQIGFQSSTDMFKLPKLHSPPIEFIGLGMLRAIDPCKKLFYVTTPLGANSLSRVNVLVLGNPDEVDMKARNIVPLLDAMEQQCTPYYTKNFIPTDLGRYTWNSTIGRAAV